MLYLQMLGRGLRPAKEKTDCLVLDHAGNVHRHGFATDERSWTLEGRRSLDEHQKRERATRDEARTLTCPECTCVFTGSRTCPECGYYFAPRGRTVQTVDGELIEIGHQLPPDEIEALAFYLELRGYAEERGHKPGYAAHLYKDKFGAFPPFSWNRYPLVVPSLETRRWVQSRQIRYAEARRRDQRSASAGV